MVPFFSHDNHDAMETPIFGGQAGNSISLQVALPSGRCKTITVLQYGSIADVKIAAQESFGQRFLRLAAPDGRLFEPTESLRLAGLHDGDSIAAVAQQPKIAATKHAFALWSGGVVAWGHQLLGGYISDVQDQLRNVQQICGTFYAFAAILANGSVVTWGYAAFGGDSSRVQDQLRNVFKICASDKAFAAILADGSVVTWGDPDHGGDSSRAQDQLRNVSADLWHMQCLRCRFGRWNRGDMGQTRRWR